jgi:hypothetical protein
MPTDAPDRATVFALPPLIVGTTLALGLLLHFVRPIGVATVQGAVQDTRKHLSRSAQVLATTIAGVGLEPTTPAL